MNVVVVADEEKIEALSAADTPYAPYMSDNGGGGGKK